MWQPGSPVGDEYCGGPRRVSTGADNKPLAVSRDVVHSADGDVRWQTIEQPVKILETQSRTRRLHICRHELGI